MQSLLGLPSPLFTPGKDVEDISKNLPLRPEEQSYQHYDGEYHHGKNEDDARSYLVDRF